MADFIIKTKKLLLLLGDLLCLYIALLLTLMLRFGIDSLSDQWKSHFLPFSIVFIFWIVIMYIGESYELKASYNFANLLNSLFKIFLANLILAVVIFYFLSPFFNGAIKPQRVLIIDVVASFVLITFWRRFFFLFLKSSKITNHCLVIGNGQMCNLLISEINKRPQLGYSAICENSIPENLKDYCHKNKIDTVVTNLNSTNDYHGSQKIFECLSLGINVYNINRFYEKITDKVPVEYIEHGWFLENLSENSKKGYEFIKRFLDVILSFIGLVISIALIPFISLIIRIESPGPIFFKQIRTGKNGKEFLAIKFRSMIQDAEKNGAQWAQINDPRVTRFGKLMRKTRVDEIPQLLNIFKGEMSFVGPRPERPEFIEMLSKEIPFYKERLLVKPGLSGWAQLKGPSYGGSKEETLEKLKYDLFYIKNRSLTLDLSIILKTIKLVLSRKGQ